MVGFGAAAHHHRDFAIVQPYKGAGRAQTDRAHQRLPDLVALVAGRFADDRVHRVGGAATGTCLARADHGGVTVHDAHDARQPYRRRHLHQLAAVGGLVVVAGDDVQPLLVHHADIGQHHAALDRVGPDRVVLGRGWLVHLARQLVLQRGHGKVHGECRMDQAVALFLHQTEFKRDQMAQHRAHQRV